MKKPIDQPLPEGCKKASGPLVSDGWKKGPLPPDTWNWGGVVPVGMTIGFEFADFCGDHVMVNGGRKVLKPEEVAWYNNSLTEPPTSI